MSDTQIKIPTTDDEKKRFMAVLDEMTANMQFIKDRRESITEGANILAEEFGIPKKVITQLAKVAFNGKFEEFEDETSTLDTLYTTLIAENRT